MAGVDNNNYYYYYLYLFIYLFVCLFIYVLPVAFVECVVKYNISFLPVAFLILKGQSVITVIIVLLLSLLLLIFAVN